MPQIGERLPNYDAGRLGVPAHEAEWQTKNLGHPGMERYRIGGDGSLEKYNCETEPIPEDEWTPEQRERVRKRAEVEDDHPLSGIAYQPTRTAEQWWEQLPDWHGSFSVHSSFDVGTETRERWEYDVQFVHGSLSRIVQTRPTPESDGVADFDSESSAHGALLPGEMEVRSPVEGYNGPIDIEVWGTPTENSKAGTVTVDIWDSPDDQHVSLELRIEEADARELGTRLIEAAARARELEVQDRDP
ncbi:hypothetical protein [Halococcus sp. IIIV-5B]|uniref:hypothetical protein n=1 Tax=Halococcus sp. IIIV-5B TaxID=2321230 RepID=UPI0011C3A3A2|nr:hypothetical protein [Halococcus sp. IIIV-5B]